VPGALQWLYRATNFWTVMVYSSRSSEPGGIDAMRRWMLEHGGREFISNHPMCSEENCPVGFPEHKPAAMLSIDDRAVCFEGDWSALDPRELLKFRPWNLREKK
jgi:hypothetical protein